MADHIVKSFQDQLDALSTGLVQMGGLCETQLANAIDADISDILDDVMIDMPATPSRPVYH